MDSVHVSVSRILGAEPDTAIKPAVWQELLRMRIALLSLAKAVDERNAAVLAELNDTEQTTGLLTHKLYLGLLCKVKVKVTETFFHFPELTRFTASAGSIVASKAFDSVVDGLSVRIEEDTSTPTGELREFILRGLYVNDISTIQLSTYADRPNHSRLSSETTFDTGGRGWNSYIFRGKPTWMSSRREAQYGYYDVAGYYYIGHIVGSMIAASSEAGSPGLYFVLYAKGALVYFNPRRV